jgi:hypothetical protein
VLAEELARAAGASRSTAVRKKVVIGKLAKAQAEDLAKNKAREEKHTQEEEEKDEEEVRQRPDAHRAQPEQGS